MQKFILSILALIFVIFAVMNRQEVAVSLWPMPYEMFAPLSLFLFGAFTFGFFAGFLSKILHNMFDKIVSKGKSPKSRD